MHALSRTLPVLGAIIVACGGRTPLGTRPLDASIDDANGARDASLDARSDAARDASPDAPDAPPVACGFDGDPSPAATSPYGMCGEGVNITYPPSDNCGGQGAAFEYVPQKAVLVTRIELHTQVGNVGLLDSDCERPGKVLFYAPLENPGAPTVWRGANVNPPIKLVPNHRYFIYGAPAQPCSAAVNGVQVREFTAPGVNGPWSGPYGGIAWSARVVGSCN